MQPGVGAYTIYIPTLAKIYNNHVDGFFSLYRVLPVARVLDFDSATDGYYTYYIYR